MIFLQINKILKLITAQRLQTSYISGLDDLNIIESPEGTRTIFVLNSSLAKALLKSKQIAVYNFLSQTIDLYGQQHLPILKNISSVFPIFLDGKAHSGIRRSFNKMLLECQGDSLKLFKANLRDILKINIKNEIIEVNSLASLISKAAMESILQSISPERLFFDPGFDYEKVDFFNTFPTKSAVHKTEKALRSFCKNMQFDSDIKTVLALSIATMGYMPLKGMLAAYLNEFMQNPNEISELSFSNVVPTNFVMRKVLKDCCFKFIDRGGDNSSITFFSNDVVYIFLGDGTSCPFTSLNTLPFGAGKHICPGKSISEEFLRITSDEIKQHATLNSTLFHERVKRAEVYREKSSAFLRYH